MVAGSALLTAALVRPLGVSVRLRLGHVGHQRSEAERPPGPGVAAPAGGPALGDQLLVAARHRRALRYRPRRPEPARPRCGRLLLPVRRPVTPDRPDHGGSELRRPLRLPRRISVAHLGQPGQPAAHHSHFDPPPTTHRGHRRVLPSPSPGPSGNPQRLDNEPLPPPALTAQPRRSGKKPAASVTNYTSFAWMACRTSPGRRASAVAWRNGGCGRAAVVCRRDQRAGGWSGQDECHDPAGHAGDRRSGGDVPPEMVRRLVHRTLADSVARGRQPHPDKPPSAPTHDWTADYSKRDRVDVRSPIPTLPQVGLGRIGRKVRWAVCDRRGCRCRTTAPRAVMMER
jgi:hypothetical protein